MKPKVTVVTIAYNQASFIAQTLGSILAQKTNFEFEVIVYDDDSSDGTKDIIRQFAKQSKLIKPLLRDKNIGSEKNFIAALRAAQGKYIALCEGDDYWTDTSKLQKQVEFLDEHPTYALCFHLVKVIFEGSHKSYIFPEHVNGQTFTTKTLLRENFIQTNSVVYRRQRYDNLPDNVSPLDWYVHLYHAKFGKIGFIPRTMSVYRRHPGGIWWEAKTNPDSFWQRHGPAHLALYEAMAKLYADKSDLMPIIDKHITDVVFILLGVDSRRHTHLIDEIALQHPEALKMFIYRQDIEFSKTIDELKKVSLDREYREELVKQRDDRINVLSAQNEAVLSELAAIKASHWYKLSKFLGSIKRHVQRKT